MITGYLFLSKIKKGNTNWTELYKGRLARIYPLYITVGLLCFVLILASVSNIHSIQVLKSALDWVLFRGGNIGNINPNRLIAGVNWTLAYEAVFYLLLPLISLVLRSNNISWKSIIFTTPIAIALAMHTSAIFYLLFLLSFLSIKRIKLIELSVEKFKKTTSLALIVLIIITMLYTNAYSILQMCLVLTIFVMIRNGVDMFGFLNFNGMKKLGDISYSIYLTHGFIIYLMFTYLHIYDFKNGFYHYIIFYPFVLFIVILTSLTTYKFIEFPCFNRSHKKQKTKTGI